MRAAVRSDLPLPWQSAPRTPKRGGARRGRVVQYARPTQATARSGAVSYWHDDG
jgi:hypothetical protein